MPTTFLLTSFYWENLIYFGAGPKKGPDGILALTYPMGDKKLPGIASEDIGRCAYGIFRKGREYIGKTVGVAGEHLTGAQMATALTEALRQPVRYNDVPPDAVPELSDSQAQRTWETCSSSSAISRRSTVVPATSASRGHSIRHCRPSMDGSRATQVASRSNSLHGQSVLYELMVNARSLWNETGTSVSSSGGLPT